MKLSVGSDGFIIGRYWYRCNNCNALAPEADSPEEAYAAAMKRDRAKGKTYAEDFGERYPDAPKEKNHKTPVACRADVYGKPSEKCQYPIMFKGMCTACWNEQMEDEDDNI